MRWLLVFAAVCGLVVGCEHSDSERTREMVPAEQLKSVSVTAHSDAPIEPQRNVVYCGTFQLVWNEMGQQLGLPLQVEGDPPLAVALNRLELTRDDVDPAAVLIMAGRIEDGIAAQAQAELSRRFPNAGYRVSDPGPEPGFFAYAYLQKNLEFAQSFVPWGGPMTFRDGVRDSPVAAFGLGDFRAPEAEAIRQQVTVLDYQNPDDWIVSLATRSAEDELIVARVPPEATLAATMAAVAARIDTAELPEDQKRIGFMEPFGLPAIRLDISRDFDELLGRGVLNQKAAGLQITMARQDIRFQFDEHGVRLESQAEIGVAMAAPAAEPRSFLCDGPFLLYLKQRSSPRPYFALWVGDAALLIEKGK